MYSSKSTSLTVHNYVGGITVCVLNDIDCE